MLHTIKGQLLRIFNLKQLFSEVGERTLDVSPDAKVYLQTAEEYDPILNFSLIKIEGTNKQTNVDENG